MFVHSGGFIGGNKSREGELNTDLDWPQFSNNDGFVCRGPGDGREGFEMFVIELKI